MLDPIAFNESVQNEIHLKSPNKIEFEDLLGKNFKESTFLAEINQWANNKKFHLIFGSKQKMKDGFKKFLLCMQCKKLRIQDNL